MCSCKVRTYVSLAHPERVLICGWTNLVNSCISVDHLEKACERLESNNVPFQKRLSDGRMKNIAFALDPDGYWVEIIGQRQSDPASASTNLDVYRFNHTMLRVKDVEKSMQFYRSVLGMCHLRTIEQPEARFNLYFLGYGREGEERDYRGEGNPLADREGLVELTWNYGTEKEEGFKYHNGNDEPQGFGVCSLFAGAGKAKMGAKMGGRTFAYLSTTLTLPALDLRT